MPVLNRQRVQVALGGLKRVHVEARTIDAAVPGPHLLVTAAQHGNEVQGSRIIQQFVTAAQTGMLAGKVTGIPFANPLALREHKPHIRMGPEQDYGNDGGFNMNRCWPGRADGHPIEMRCHDPRTPPLCRQGRSHCRYLAHVAATKSLAYFIACMETLAPCPTTSAHLLNRPTGASYTCSWPALFA